MLFRSHSTSSELIKNVADQRARGAFQGLIEVNRDAQKTDARMMVVIELDDAQSPFSAEEIVTAIKTPTWTLRLGRAGCPPDEPIVANAVQASSLAEAAAGIEGELVYLPVDATDPQLGDVYQPIYGRRDWRANRHGGEEIYVVRAA